MRAPLWDRCLLKLEAELSDQQLNTWIRPLQAWHEADQLRILAPNRFVLDMVQSSFHARIQEIASALTAPESIEVKLVIGSGQANETRDAFPALDREQPNRSRERNSMFGAAPAKSQIAKSIPPLDSHLKPEFSFNTLVAGKSNQLGRAAALQIGGAPGTAYNPYLIYGASGLGKTHLMQAIGNEILANKPDARVSYINSETYVHEMVNALQHGKMNEFKAYYRGLDALLIDDIQFFAGKEQTQEEFFHNFNALFEGNQQIVLTCDRYPKEINGLEERLKTRFGWGLSVAIEPPELEMRVAILNSKAEQRGVILPSEVSFFIAKRIRSNVRELEGALKRVIANSQLIGTPITLEFTREALADLLAVQAKTVSIENIQKTVAEYYNIRLADLSGKSRSRSVARPRQLAMALAKELTSKSLPEIGKVFGGRDHTTVLHACRKIVELKESDDNIREDYSNLLRTLSN
ncbi:chromosomal replication initiator protein DnaA [Granulosicoccus antarcticus]|uniref:chromosomal replication initiator protein DnaA n=1 Tax=Granulosicoccus antarcticus TaxID=437505 RepID=UPI000B5AA97E|nr:chromosomal replication initiator protein DnaA [Granulosicoccus antarcticus]